MLNHDQDDRPTSSTILSYLEEDYISQDIRQYVPTNSSFMNYEKDLIGAGWVPGLASGGTLSVAVWGVLPKYFCLPGNNQEHEHKTGDPRHDEKGSDF